MMWWYGDNGTGSWGAVLMMISMVLFWALAVVATTALVRHLLGTGRSRTTTPEQVLGERLARGEIDEQEFRRIRDALREPRPVVAS